MSIRLVVAVTDKQWFDLLRTKPELPEVNFWAPNPRGFRALDRGELFLFKLHAPHDVIVGGGVFAYANVLPCSLAWHAFGEANGAESAEGMRQRIVRYRGAGVRSRRDFEIGCRILTQPFFFDEPDWMAAPNWSRNIVSLKAYSTDNADGLHLWESVQDRLGRASVAHFGEEAARFGAPQLIRPRLGQGTFRVLVTDIYKRRCAVTRERTLPALEAAHIRPYRDGGTHEERNGLLLRRDIHSLFDAGYVTVTPNLNFEVSGRIKEEFENGRDYYRFHGCQINAPDDIGLRPDPAVLTWHNDNCFMG